MNGSKAPTVLSGAVQNGEIKLDNGETVTMNSSLSKYVNNAVAFQFGHLDSYADSKIKEQTGVLGLALNFVRGIGEVLDFADYLGVDTKPNGVALEQTTTTKQPFGNTITIIENFQP